MHWTAIAVLGWLEDLPADPERDAAPVLLPREVLDDLEVFSWDFARD